MKFITFKKPNGEQHAGWLENNKVYSFSECTFGELPNNMLDFLKNSEENMQTFRELSNNWPLLYHSLNEVELTAPLPNPASVRDFMAFEKHLLNASKQSGIEVHPEWYNIPAFYFSNHQAIVGPEEKIEIPPNCTMFDYELEIAAVIGKEGKNIKATDADDYIFGYTILNDWSARDLQGQEMKIGLGPAKGKDTCTSIGPYIVPKDELKAYKTDRAYNLKMTAKVNGKLLSEGNFNSIHYTFGQMIECASAGTTLYPGDIIGSGTVGTGCLLELGPKVHRWLKSGDVVELEITGLGVLRNVIG